MDNNNNIGKMYNLSMTDLPISDTEADALDVLKYVNALKQFVLECSTPMSIALQGDWGTGKTSLIKMLENALANENKDILSIYFNTWQYSQFNMSGNVYSAFIRTILEKLCEVIGKEKTEFIKNTLPNVLANFANQFISHKTGLDLIKVIEPLMYVNNENENIKKIENLKSEFQKLVNSVAEQKNRIIIFVDDLDRLNPEMAVELLEVMKLFMDVQSCIFVLAIDYEVVVSGIRKKYGSEMSNEKCRSFFDKIIQVPFRMPVESYSIDKLITTQLRKDELSKYINTLTNLFKHTLGSNPRTLKRVINSFKLLRIVNSSTNESAYTNDEKKDTLLLANLILQMYAPAAYEKLLAVIVNSDEPQKVIKELLDSHEIENYFLDKKLDEKENKEKLEEIIDHLNSIKEAISENKDEEYIYSLIVETMTTSSITSVTSEKPKKSPSRINVDSVEFGENSFSVSSAAEALKQTIDCLFQNKEDQIGDILDKCKEFVRKEKPGDDEKKSMFRAIKEFEISGVKYYVGTSSGNGTKLDQVNKICHLLNFDNAIIKWKDGDDVIYSSESILDRKWERKFQKNL